MKKKGFTLIELLIVISIIGILSTMVIPGFTSAQDKAKEAAVKSVMHSMQLAVESYNVSEGVYPAGSNLAISELYVLLNADGYLKKIPKNPFTNDIYSAADTAGQIYYSYDDDEGEYTLSGYDRSGSNCISLLTSS
jgi:type II secretion system protein G